MVAVRAAVVTEASRAVRALPRNGLEPAPRPAMDRWHCEGWNAAKHRPCGALLMEVALSPGSRVRIKCPKCNTWSVREGIAAADGTEREGDGA